MGPNDPIAEAAGPAPPPTDPLLGQVLEDRFAIEAVLGEGGMAIVYRARDLSRDREVVVKMPRARLLADPAFRERFRREVAQLRLQDHPAIVRIEHVGQHEDCPFAVLEMMKGGSLRERLEKAPDGMTREAVLAWLPDIAEALDAVHAGGALHRDVKPGNILFDEDGVAHLSDFGITTALGAADPDAPTTAIEKDLTVVGTFIGSPAYAAPEAIDRRWTAAYDQYGLATIAYRALTGRLPFEGATSEAILIAKEKQPPPPPSEWLPRGALHPAAEAALLRALAKAPEARFASCRAFAEAFASDALPVPVPEATKPARAAPLWRRPHVLAPAGVAASVAAVAVWLASSSVPSTAAIGDGPVRRGQFADFVAATGHRTTAEQRGYSWDETRCRQCNWRSPDASLPAEARSRTPVVHVSFVDARAFCGWAGGRLPSVLEWDQLASRAPAAQAPGRAAARGLSEWTATRAGSGERRLVRGGGDAAGRPSTRSEEPDYSSATLGFRCTSGEA